MNRATSYIRYQIGLPFLFFSAGLTGVMLVVQSLRTVDLVVNQGLSAAILAELTLYLLPSALSLILPIALFCAIMFSYYRLWQDSELTVMSAIGLGPARILWPAVELSLVVTALVYVLSLYVAPWGLQGFRAELTDIRNDIAAILLKDGEFNEAVAGVTIYVRERTPAGELAGILIYDARKPGERVAMTAERGAVLANGSDGAKVLLLNGTRQDSNTQAGTSTFLSFDRYVLDLGTLYSDLGSRWLKPGERYIGELLPPYHDPEDERNAAALLAEAHRRLALPLYCVPLALIAAGGIVGGGHPRRGRGGLIVAATLAGLLFRFSELGLGGLVAAEPARAPLLYLWPVAVGIAAVLAPRLGRRRRPAFLRPRTPRGAMNATP